MIGFNPCRREIPQNPSRRSPAALCPFLFLALLVVSPRNLWKVQFKPLFQIRAGGEGPRVLGSSDNHDPQFFLIIKPFDCLLGFQMTPSICLDELLGNMDCRGVGGRDLIHWGSGERHDDNVRLWEFQNGIRGCEVSNTVRGKCIWGGASQRTSFVIAGAQARDAADQFPRGCGAT